MKTHHLIVVCASFVFFSCNSSSKDNINDTSSLDADTASSADTNWRATWQTESVQLENKLNELGNKLQKSGHKVAVEVDVELKNLELQRKSFDTSRTRAEERQSWEKFKTKANRVIDSLNARLTIE